MCIRFPESSVLVPREFIFFFNDTATTEIYTLSLHDALPISCYGLVEPGYEQAQVLARRLAGADARYRGRDRKSTRLNSSHANISYAVFCLKKSNRSIQTSHHVSFA